ncbi:MAG: PQQ-binding-like beta-propeller repeat protein [Planctomycetota bacterium]
MMHSRILITLICFNFTITASGQDWAQWRGPTGDNHAATGATAPTTWSDTEGLAWTTPIPGRGHSSPIVFGSRIYLTTADNKSQTQSLLILDRQSGKLLTEKVVHRGKFAKKIYPTNTHASSSVACDGKHIFTLFLNDDAAWLTSFDLAGEQLWQRRLAAFAPKRYEFGYGSSPVIYGDSVIVASEYDGPESCLVALDTSTGKEKWRTPRPQGITYSTPAIARLKSGDQLLLSGSNLVAGYDPRDGKELWQTPGTTQLTCATMIWDEKLGLAFASGGYPKQETVAVELAGNHDVVWKNRVKCYESSMLMFKGYIYAISDNSIAYCWRGSDGKEMWKKRLKGPFSSSPLLVGDRIYMTNEAGTTFVLRTTPDKFDLLAKNQLGTGCYATPAPLDGRLYHRFFRGDGAGRKEYLSAIGTTQ